jgi:GGDEF domain-containing protein
VSLPALPRDAPSLEALRDAVDGLDQQVTLVAPDGRVVHVNRARRDAVAIDPSWPGPAADRDPLRTAEAGDAQSRAIAAGVRAVLAGDRPAYEVEYTRASRWFALRATAIAVDGVGAIVEHTDVTSRRRAERGAGHRPDPDALPGLASRRLIAQRLEELLAAGPVGVVVLRLRRSGPRSLDRLVGDAEDVVRRTAELVEQLVPEGAVTGRHGADRFVVLLPGVDEPGLRRAAVPLAAGWRARIGRAEDLEASIDTSIAQPGDDTGLLLARTAGGRTIGRRPVAMPGGGVLAGL